MSSIEDLVQEMIDESLPSVLTEDDVINLITEQASGDILDLTERLDKLEAKQPSEKPVGKIIIEFDRSNDYHMMLHGLLLDIANMQVEIIVDDIEHRSDELRGALGLYNHIVNASLK
jgi:hypothetical protein